MNVLDNAIKAIHEWIKSQDVKTIAEVKDDLESRLDRFVDGSYSYPDMWHGTTIPETDLAVATTRYASEETTVWAMEMDKEDSKYEQQRWHTRIGLQGNGQCIRVNMQITRYFVSGFFGKWMYVPQNVPRIMKDLMSMDKALATVAGIEITSHDVELDHEAFDNDFVPALLDPERELPLIVILTNDDGLTPVWCAEDVAAMVVGMAKVYVLDWRSHELRNDWNSLFKMGTHARNFGCGPDSVIVFLPGVDLEKGQQKGVARYFTRKRIDKYCERGNDQFISVLCDGLSRAVGRKPDDIMGLADVEWTKSRSRARHREAQIRQLKERRVENKVRHGTEGDELSALKNELEKLEQENKEITALWEEVEEDNDTLQSQLDELKEQNFVLTERSKSRKQVVEVPPEKLVESMEVIPSTSAEILDLAQAVWKDRLAILETAIESAKEYDEKTKGKTQETWEVIRHCATTLWSMHFEENPSNFCDEFKSRTGYELALKEGKLTANSSDLMRQRSGIYKGEKVSAPAHIKGHGRKQPLRVHYYVDQEDRKIVIVHCGDHLETAGSKRKGF